MDGPRRADRAGAGRRRRRCSQEQRCVMEIARPRSGGRWGSRSRPGINLYATVAILGLASRYGWVALPPQYQVFDNNWIIGAALALYVIEFVADKIPWIDSVWDAVHTVIRPVGGALIAVATLGRHVARDRDAGRPAGRRARRQHPLQQEPARASWPTPARSRSRTGSCQLAEDALRRRPGLPGAEVSRRRGRRRDRLRRADRRVRRVDRRAPSAPRLRSRSRSADAVQRYSRTRAGASARSRLRA